MIEPLVLFWVIFLPGIAPGGGGASVLDFDPAAELGRMLIYDGPALALTLLVLLRNQKPSSVGFPVPRPRDGVIAAATLLSLMALAAILSSASSFFGMQDDIPMVVSPRGIPSWVLMALGGMLTGYMEETFFRSYLFFRLDEAGIGKIQSIAVSVTLFALCHLYEGPWGLLNAAGAGIIFSLAYLKGSSVHGVAWAHGVYNILVYSMGAKT